MRHAGVAIGITVVAAIAGAAPAPAPPDPRTIEHARAAVLDVLGDRPGTLAPALAGVRMYTTEAEARAALAPLAAYASAAAADLTLDFTEGVLHGVEVRFPFDRTLRATDCRRVVAELEARWGPADPALRDTYRRWLDPRTGLRVAMGGMQSGCDLVVEPALPRERWIDARTPTAAVPLWAVGMPATALERVLPAHVVRGGTVVSWRAPGLAGGTGDTTVTVALSAGRIRSVHATTTVGPKGYDALVAHLRALFGAPRDASSGLRFPGRPGLRVEYAANGTLHVLADAPRRRAPRSRHRGAPAADGP